MDLIGEHQGAVAGVKGIGGVVHRHLHFPLKHRKKFVGLMQMLFKFQVVSVVYLQIISCAEVLEYTQMLYQENGFETELSFTVPEDVKKCYVLGLKGGKWSINGVETEVEKESGIADFEISSKEITLKYYSHYNLYLEIPT